METTKTVECTLSNLEDRISRIEAWFFKREAEESAVDARLQKHVETLR